MATRNEIWSVLRRVQSLRFESQSDSTTGWEGVGTGIVNVTEPAAGIILFTESGTWQPSSRERPATQFSNVFRWSIAAEMLRLEHLRFGPNHPVHLFDMAQQNDGFWREVSAHQCRADCYAASLTTSESQLFITWSIVGPRKCETIRYTYG